MFFIIILSLSVSFCFYFETESYCVAILELSEYACQASFESRSTCICLQNAGIKKGVCYHALPRHGFDKQQKPLIVSSVYLSDRKNISMVSTVMEFFLSIIY